MHPAPVKVARLADLPPRPIFINKLPSGELIYMGEGGEIYAVQPHGKEK